MDSDQVLVTNYPSYCIQKNPSGRKVDFFPLPFEEERT